MIDLGNSFETKTADASNSVEMILPATNDKLAAGENDLMAIDQFLTAAIRKGNKSLVRNYIHPQLRILWPDRKPAINKENADNLVHRNQSLVFHQQQAYIASSKDLGVVYGTCENGSPMQDKKISLPSICMFGEKTRITNGSYCMKHLNKFIQKQ